MEKTKRSTTEKIRIYKELFGTSSVSDQERIVCIPDKLRMRHFYVNGRPSMSMSTLLEHMIMDDIKKGHGVAIIDLHSDMVKRILDACPPGSQNNQTAK
jgi:hypothetical protein